MKRPAVVRESIPYISKMAIGNARMECRNSKKIPPLKSYCKYKQLKKTTKQTNLSDFKVITPKPIKDVPS